MRPALFTSAAALSILIGLLVIGQWAGGLGQSDHWIVARDVPNTSGPPTQKNIDVTFDRGSSFGWYSNRWTHWTYDQLIIPYWVVLLLTSIVPLLWAWRHWVRSQNPRGLLCGLRI